MSIYQQTPLQKQRQQKLMIIFGFIIPLALSLLPLIHGDYRQSSLPLSDTICFVQGGQNDPIGNFMLFFCFYIPIVLTVIFNITCVYQVIQRYKQCIPSKDVLSQVKHLLFYPLILIICWIGFLILRVMDCFDSAPEAYIFQIICYATSNLNGFFDGLAYGMNTIVRVWRQNNLDGSSSSFQSGILAGSQSDLSECLQTTIPENQSQVELNSNSTSFQNRSEK